ncbi:MAG: energy transducer TonB [Bacteroidetes bacterium]|nr:energy transducer TonB [Bacteroidota bacterium]
MSVIAFSQTDSLDASGDPRLKTNTGMTVLDAQPEYPGGYKAMNEFLLKNVHYPDPGLEQGVGGTVYIKVTIDERGHMRDPRVLKGISPEFDIEALRLISIMPDWKPAIQNGKYCKTYLNLPVKFSLK